MKKVVYMVHGSHLYGTNTAASDTDYKGIFVPERKDLLLGKAPEHFRSSTGDPHAKNTADDVDEVLFSVNKFLKMASEGETIAIDMLHCPHPLEGSLAWSLIRKHRSLFYTRNMKAFLGYARKQAGKYGVKGSRLGDLEEVIAAVSSFRIEPWQRLGEYIDFLPKMQFCFPVEHEGNFYYEVLGRKYQNTIPMESFRDQLQKLYDSYGDRAKAAKENKGVDWKAMSHALRAVFQLEEIYTTGDLNYPLKSRGTLLSIKQGEVEFTKVQHMLESGIDKVETLAANSNFPTKVNANKVDNLALEIYSYYGY